MATGMAGSGSSHILMLVLLMSFGSLFASAQVQGKVCHDCPSDCQTLPGAPGLCGSCICAGKALPPCPKMSTCPPDCRVAVGPEGCDVCICGDDPPHCTPAPDCSDTPSQNCTLRMTANKCLECRCRFGCPPRPVCAPGCQMFRDDFGCEQCDCRDDTDPYVCPPLGPCPQLCQVEQSSNSCPRCQCPPGYKSGPNVAVAGFDAGGKGPQGTCNRLTCPAGCDVTSDNDGCWQCSCPKRDSVCSPMPSCYRDCIVRMPGSDCFFCNCSIPTSISQGRFGPFSHDPYGPFGPQFPPGRRSPWSFPIDFSVPSACEPLECPRECQVKGDRNGCRFCDCGPNNLICPPLGVCYQDCITRDAASRCLKCTCTVPQFAIQDVLHSHQRYFPSHPRTPFGGFQGAFRGRPQTQIPRQPFVASASQTVSSFSRPNTVCPPTPDVCRVPECTLFRDNNGCQRCECPPNNGCPPINCPPSCVAFRDNNGCMQCNCNNQRSRFGPFGFTEAVDSAGEGEQESKKVESAPAKVEQKAP